EREAGEVVLAEDRRDDRREEVGDESRDDRGERGTDDHCDRQIDDVAPEQERLEFLQHHCLLDRNRHWVVRGPSGGLLPPGGWRRTGVCCGRGCRSFPSTRGNAAMSGGESVVLEAIDAFNARDVERFASLTTPD